MNRFRVVRCCALCIVVLAALTWAVMPASAGVILPTATFTDDASSGISSATTYTHKLDFGNQAVAAAINGVTFNKVGTSGAGFTMSAGINGYAAGATGSIGVASSQAIYNLLNDFVYNGNPGTLTITGLTPGTKYEARLYYRLWGGPRNNNVVFDEGTGSAQTLANYNEDADSAAHYLRYEYVAGASGSLAITTTIVSGGSWHWYGFSNEVVPLPSTKWISASSTDWGTDANWDPAAKPDAATALATFGAAGTTGTVDLGSAGRTLGGLTFQSGVSTTIGSTLGNTLTLDNGANTASVAASGTHEISAGVALNSSGAISVNSGQLTLSGVVANGINGAKGIIKSGAGTLVLSNINTYSGGTTLSGGTARINDNLNLGDAAGGITFNGGTLQTTAGITSARSITVNTSTTGTFDSNGFDSILSGMITGAGNLTKIGAGTLALTGPNTGYTGTTTINAGVVRLDNADALQKSTVAITAANGLGFGTGIAAATIGGLTGAGNLALTNTDTNPVALSVGANNTSPAAHTGVISGGGSLIKTGTAQLWLAGASTYTGGTTINSGSLRIGAPGSLGAGAVNIANGANLLLWWNTGSNVFGRDITLNGPGSVDTKPAVYGDGGGGGFAEYVLSGTITLNNSPGGVASNIGGNVANNVRLTGNVTGPGGLTKGGSRTDENDTLILAPAAGKVIDYQGDTTVKKGTLKLGANNAIPFGAGKGNVAVNAGTTLDLGGFDQTINGLSGGGTVTNNRATPGANTLTIGANNSTGTFGGLIQNGANGIVGVTKTGSNTMILTGSNTYTGPTVISEGTLQVWAPVPATPVAHYSFDADASDDAGAHPGTLVGVPSFVAGINGNAVSLNGTSQYISVPYAADFAMKNYTVSLWAKVNTIAPATQMLLSTRQGQDNTFDAQYYNQYLHGDFGGTNVSGGVTWLHTAADYNPATKPVLPVGTWKMVTYVITDNGASNAASWQIYLDGSPVAAGNAATAGSPLFMRTGSTMFIGAYGGPSLFVNGAMDDVYIYNRALSGSDVAGLYQRGAHTSQGIASRSAVTLNTGATLDMTGVAMTIGSLSGSGNVLLGAGALNTGGDGTSTTFSGDISGTGSLTKTGAGTMTVTSALSYGGATTVNAGTLVLSGPQGSIASSSAYVIGPGTLRLDNFTDNNNVRLNAAAPITLHGGTVQFIGNASTPTALSVGTVSQDVGDSTVVLSGAGGPHTVNAIPGLQAPTATLNVVGSDANHVLNLTGVTSGFMGPSYYSGGSDFAWYDSGVVRQINYGTDANSVLNDGSTALVPDKYTKLTGLLSGQDDATIRSLNLAGSGAGAEMNDFATLRLTTGGLIKSGGGSAGTIGVVAGGDSSTVTLTAGASPLIVRTDTAADQLTISVPITGAGLVKSGAGTLTLTNAGNSYSGGTVLNGGALNFLAGSVPTGANKITFAGGALQWGASNTQDVSSSFAPVAAGFSAILDTGANDITFGTAVTGNGGLTKTGAGTLALSVANTYAGPTAVNGGVLRFVNGAIPAGANRITFGGGTLQWATGNTQDISASIAAVPAGQAAILDTNSQTVTLASPIAGDGGLTKAGAGTLVLTGESTYTGATTINAGGTLQIGAGGTIGSISSASAVTNNGSLVFNRSNDLPVGNNIVGTGTVTKLKAGKVTLSGTNSFASAALTAGTLSVGSEANLGGATSALTFNGGILQVTGTAINNLDTHTVNWPAFSGGFDIADAGNTFTVSQVLAGTGTLLKYGPGRLVLSGNNTYSGVTQIYAGTVRITTSSGLGVGGHNGATMANIYDGAALELEGGISSPEHFHFWGKGPTGNGSIVSISGNNALINGPGYCLRSDGIIRVDADSLRITHLYQYQANVQMEKTGAGTLIFDGDPNVFVSGGGGAIGDLGTSLTLISEGTLQFGNGGATSYIRPGSPIVDNATLAFNRSNQMDLNNPISGTGSVKQIGTGVTRLSGTNTYTGGTTINAGVLRFDAAGAIPATGTITVNFGGTAAAGPADFAALLSKIPTSSEGSVALTADSTGDIDLSTYPNLSLGAVGSANFNNVYTPSGTTYRLGGGGGILTYSSAITGDKGLLICGSGSGGTVVLTGSNDYTGTTTVAGGLVSISSDDKLGAAPTSATPGKLVLAGGGLQATASFTLDSNRGIALGPASGSGNATIDVTDGNTLTYNGIAANNAGGTGGLMKIGLGTLTLGGANTYTGPTQVNAGTLNLNSTAPVASLIVRGGAVNTGSGVSVGTATFVKGTVDTGVNTLAVTNKMEVGPTTWEGKLTVSGSNLRDDSVARAVRVTSGTLTVTPTAVPTTGLQTVPISQGATPITDAASGISSDNVYTHAVSFNTTATVINGVTFARDMGVAAGGISNSGSRQYGANPWGPAIGNNHGMIGTISQAATPGLESLYTAFFYANAGDNSVTLTGLLPGEFYDLRIYEATFGGGANRQFTVKYDVGATSYTTPIINQDLATTAPNPGSMLWNDVWALSYVYKADATGTIKATINNQTGDTHHLYGLTNQALPSPNINYPNTNVELPAGTTLALNTPMDVNLGTLIVSGLGAKVGGGTATPPSLSFGGIQATDNSSLIGSSLPMSIRAGGTVSVAASKTLTMDSNLVDGPAGALTALAKVGDGTLTLKGANTYTGGTTVDAGALEIASAAALPAGRSLTIGAGGTVVLSSGLSAAGGAGGQASAAPVPEPGTVALLIAAAGSLAILVWRRRK